MRLSPQRFILRNLLIGTILVALGGAAQADENNDRVGTRAFPFLKRGIGARAAGLAGAFTGLADDETALYYNPAGLAGIDGRRLLLSYQNFIAGINAGYVGYVSPLSQERTLGLFLNYVNYGTFIRTDGTGAEIGDFGGTALVVGGSVSQKFNEKYQAGANVKLIYTKFDTFTATGAALDAGLRYIIQERISGYERRGFGSIGLAVQNLGAQLSTYTIDADKDPLPIIARLGAAGRPRGIPVLLSADAILPADNDLHYAFGVEYSDIEHLSLRAGWSSFGENFKSEFNSSELAGFSFGVGFSFNRLEINYAISPMNDLGETHRVTVTRNFADFIE